MAKSGSWSGVLHTWDQTLGCHYHVHCVIPGGAIAADGKRWIPARANFLFSVRALSTVFRAKFLDHLAAAHRNKKLVFLGSTASLVQAKPFNQLISVVREKNWVVYAKRPFASPDTVLAYLGRYTHRTAISNHWIVAVDEETISFSYRDRKDAGQKKLMTLGGEEFLRRFLLHVLPPGVMRTRHFGFLANRSKATQLQRCRKAMNAPPPEPVAPSPGFSEWVEKNRRCPRCGVGTLVPVRALAPIPPDTS